MGTSVRSRPWESYIMVFAVHGHTGVNVPECSGPQVVVLTVCTHAPLRVCTLSVILFVSVASEVCPLVSTLTRCQGLLLAVRRKRVTPIVIMLDMSFPDWPVMERKASDG